MSEPRRRTQKRGEFSPIARALVDGPDFQQLAPRARHVFLTLKVMIGPSGIEVHYPDALVAILAHTTGLTSADVTAALGQLQETRWVEREAHVLWIVAQLQYHPGMVATNENHRLGVQNHVAGLPRLGIVRRFIEHYGPFFVDVPDVLDAYPVASPPLLALVPTDGIAMPMASAGLLHHAVPNTQTHTQTQDEEPSCAADAATQTKGDASLVAFAEFWSLYPKRSGGNSRTAAEKCWKARIRERVASETMIDGVKRYRDYCLAAGKVGTEYVMQASTFIGPTKRYEEDWEIPVEARSNPLAGLMTDDVELATRRPSSRYAAALAGGGR